MVARYCTTGLTCQSPCVPGACSIKPVRRYVVCFEDKHGARAVRGGGRAPRPALIAIAARGPGPIRGGSPPHCLVRCITVLRSVALNHTLLRTANEADGTRFATPRQAGQGLVAVCAKDHLGTAVDLLRLGQVPSLGRMVWKFHGGRTSRTCGSRWTNLQRGDVPMINVLEICIPVAAPIASKKGVLCRQGNWGFIPVAQAVGRLAPALPCNTTTNKLLHLILTF